MIPTKYKAFSIIENNMVPKILPSPSKGPVSKGRHKYAAVCESQGPQSSVPLVEVQLSCRGEDKRQGEVLQSSDHIPEADSHTRYTFLPPLALRRSKLGHQETAHGRGLSYLQAAGWVYEFGVVSVSVGPLLLPPFPSSTFLSPSSLFSFPFFLLFLLFPPFSFFLPFVLSDTHITTHYLSVYVPLSLFLSSPPFSPPPTHSINISQNKNHSQHLYWGGRIGPHWAFTYTVFSIQFHHSLILQWQRFQKLAQNHTKDAVFYFPGD